MRAFRRTPTPLAALSVLGLLAAGATSPRPREAVRPTLSRPSAKAGAASEARRVSFHIRTLVGRGGAHRTATDATVEGPPGTDISIRSQAGAFALSGTLRTDLLAPGRLRIVADLTARRGAGRSQRGLPLYEEDVQRRRVELTTDGSQSLVVLPFGRNPGGEELALDILPSLTPNPVRDRSGQWVPPEIHIAETGPEEWLRIDAEWVPHRYRVEALLESGVSISGVGRCELAEPCELTLRPKNEGAGPNPYRLGFTVTRYVHTSPASITFEFNLRAAEARPGAASGSYLVRRAAGVALAGLPVTFPFAPRSEGGSHPSNAPRVLTLKVTPEDLP